MVVAFTDDPEIPCGAKLKSSGLQVAAGVRLMCGEGDDFSSFRIGLFGLDKLGDVDGTVQRLEERLDQLDAGRGAEPNAGRGAEPTGEAPRNQTGPRGWFRDGLR